MRPFHVFCFLLVVMIFVTGYRFRDVFSEETGESTEDHQLIVNRQGEDSIIQVTVPADEKVFDTIKTSENTVADTKTVTVQPDSMLIKPGTDLLAGNLDTFFTKLLQLNEKQLRVIYYGDSQIEGDHITYSFRKGLQEKFGGGGIGFIPAKMYFNTTHDLAVVTSDFDAHSITYSNKVDGPYGLYGKFYALNGEDGNLRIINRTGKANYSVLRFFSTGKSNVEIMADSKVVCSKSLDSSEIDVTKCTFGNTPGEVRIKFRGSHNFKLHGIALESETGILVDNVSFRGNLTLMAHRFDKQLVQQMKAFLNPSLFILHFGLNVIPDFRPDYSDYRAALERDIRFLQKQVPSASFLVISASDMMHKEGGELVVYKNIDDIIRAQQQAAVNTGIAFWNIQDAMGGPGAIKHWVEKGWARTDYAHITLEGSNYVGGLLFEDIMNAFQHYKSENRVRQMHDSLGANPITMKN
jgi:hypothetical protein